MELEATMYKHKWFTDAAKNFYAQDKGTNYLTRSPDGQEPTLNEMKATRVGSDTQSYVSWNTESKERPIDSGALGSAPSSGEAALALPARPMAEPAGEDESRAEPVSVGQTEQDHSEIRSHPIPNADAMTTNREAAQLEIASRAPEPVPEIEPIKEEETEPAKTKSVREIAQEITGEGIGFSFDWKSILGISAALGVGLLFGGVFKGRPAIPPVTNLAR
jgi:hypothetical protein